MFIDLSEFVDRHSVLIAQAYELSGAAMSADRKCGAQLPVKRVGRPQDIAEAILFPRKNGFVNVITLMIDGGRLLA